jgi:branched-chain amino acid aminotransferase
VETIRTNRLRSAYLRPIVFLGDGEMGLAAVQNPVRVAIAAWPWGAYLGEEGVARGVRVKTSSFQRMHVNTFMTKAKAVGNYVNSILAAVEARSAGYDEAMMLDTEGYVCECSGENVFIVRRGVVKTPPLTSVLEGITRATVLSLLRAMDVPVVEERFTRDEAYVAEEVFITGTAAEVTPVRELDGRQIGGGVPGAITRMLQERYRAVVQGRDPAFREWITEVA